MKKLGFGLMRLPFHPEMSVASWAIRYASLENMTVVLSGMNNFEQ